MDMTIYLSGSKSGTNHFVNGVDTFESTTELSIGSIKIANSVKGTSAGGRLKGYHSDSKSPTGTAVLDFDGSKLTAVTNGKKVELPFKDTTGFWGGSLHPQFLRSSVDQADALFKKNPAAKEVTVNAYFIDTGSILPLTFTVLPSKKIDVSGSSKVIKRYTMILNGIAAEIDRTEDGVIVGEDVPVQKLRFLVDGYEALYEDPIAKYPELSQARFTVKPVEEDMVVMRDGIKLSTSILKPTGDRKFPVILSRTPYGKSTELANAPFFVSRGYIFVSQDCRGREESEGVWDPFMNEGPDGFDTIAWIAKQPWCDGNVGMIGGSYGGYVQWATAVMRPPALKCIIPQVSPPDAMHNLPYDFGVFMLSQDLWWSRIVAGKKTDFTGLRSGVGNQKALLTLPLSKVDDKFFGHNVPFFDKWLKREKIGDWKGFDFTYSLDKVTIPALHISGIWDGDEIGTHINWNRMRELGRTNQWIIFGPWVHAFNTTHSFGGVEYGQSAIIDLDSVYLRWFDTWLKHRDINLDKMPKARIFVTGANKWMTADGWPTKTQKLETMYLGSKSLSLTRARSGVVNLIFDPSKAKVAGEGAVDGATTLLKKKDLISKYGTLFRSSPLSKDKAISGPLELSIEFSSSAVNTDFGAIICDEAPDGSLRLLGQPGKIRTAYLQGYDKVRPMTPGKRYVASIIPWDFAHAFKKGHRLAVYLTSSLFPTTSRNLGTVDPIFSATRMVVQKNKIYLGVKNSKLTYHVLWEK